MARKQSQASEHEKERMRAEIDSQVEDFLRRGGKIDVLTDKPSGRRADIGSVWHAQDDMGNLVPQ